jgi:hypothetical protein
MTGQTFRIRRELLIPFGICVAGLMLLLVLALFGKGSGLERVVLVVLTAFALAFLLLARDRWIAFEDEKIIIRKFFRIKELRGNDINDVGCVILRKRVYLLLTTTKGFFILSNAYADFPALVQNITRFVDPERIEPEVRTLTEKTIGRWADVISMWIAVAIITGLVILKLSSV